MTKEWKNWQAIYNSLVTDHSDAAAKHKRVMDEKTVENVLFYFREKADYGIYPAKSYAIAIIYATMLLEVYKEPFYESLDDPLLLYGQDEFFVPYSQDKEFYDQVIVKFKELRIPLAAGWGEKTIEYFFLECTSKGVDFINNPQEKFDWHFEDFHSTIPS